jgi:hypothetical protein
MLTVKLVNSNILNPGLEKFGCHSIHIKNFCLKTKPLIISKHKGKCDKCFKAKTIEIIPPPYPSFH